MTDARHEREARRLDDLAAAGDAEVLRLDGIEWFGPAIDVRWGVDDHTFVTSHRYEGVDFDSLAARHGRHAVDRLAFHIAMFEINKGISFGPERVEIAEPWLGHLTPELADLWRVVGHKVWAQWRYEHDRPDYIGPTLPVPPTSAGREVEVPLTLGAGEVRTLVFCGGGKDSLLAAHLLDVIGEPYDAFAYAHSVYGEPEPQLALISGLLDVTAAVDRRRLRTVDTALEFPAVEVGPDQRRQPVLAAETPASVFAALPLALTHGYRRLVVAHERSANTGNLIWDATGEDVNHQWGKSLEAEKLIGAYIAAHLMPGLEYFSVLQPVHDALIFASLRDLVDAVPRAHSCNVDKPWCRRCAKCAYVWISYRAWLPWNTVDAAFGSVNLLDLPENERWFREMLGLEAHTPFECVGQIDEARLAFAMARRRGLDGRWMGLLDEVEALDDGGALEHGAILDRYLAVDGVNHHLPRDLAVGVLDFFAAQATAARAFAVGVLGGRGPGR